jgi:hypothetical protein
MAAIAATATKAKTEPFVVVSTLRTQAEVIHKHCLAACPDSVIKKYNSDLSAANHKDFDDVNKAWAKVDILIYTLTISAGCSFELPRFTRVFGYFSSLSTDYKTAVSGIYQPGNTTYISIHKPMTYPSTRNKWRRVLLISLEC